MAQQLPLYQIPMPQQPNPQAIMQGYNQPPLQMQPQVVMNDGQAQGGGFENVQMNAQPQVLADVSPQSMAVAGANQNGVDWRGALATLGSYLAATGQGMAGASNTAQGFAQGMTGATKNMQNIRQYDTMKPYYQQMGYDVSKLDPRRGGAGVASTPESMIQLQSLVDQRNMNNLYRQQMIQAMQDKSAQKQQSTPTIGDLMMYNPQFKQMMNAQYDFSNGQNADVLSRPMPKEVLQSLMPKNVNMNYSGGLNSSKTSNATIRHTGTSGAKGKGKPNAHTW